MHVRTYVCTYVHTYVRARYTYLYSHTHSALYRKKPSPPDAGSCGGGGGAGDDEGGGAGDADGGGGDGDGDGGGGDGTGDGDGGEGEADGGGGGVGDAEGGGDGDGDCNGGGDGVSGVASLASGRILTGTVGPRGLALRRSVSQRRVATWRPGRVVRTSSSPRRANRRTRHTARNRRRFWRGSGRAGRSPFAGSSSCSPGRGCA